MDSSGTHTTLDIAHRAKINNTHTHKHTHTEKRKVSKKGNSVDIILNEKKVISFKRFIILLALSAKSMGQSNLKISAT